jgi:hypothetical protein
MNDIRNECEKICNQYNIHIDSNLNNEQFIIEFVNRVDWVYISECEKLNESFIREFTDEVNWVYISQYQNLSEGFIREFANKIRWACVSKFQNLSEGFIREFADKVGWNYISQHQNLSESFIKEFAHKVNWEYISKYQKLNEEFIREFADKVDWDYISCYQKLSEGFRKEYNVTILDSNWLYKTAEEKRVWLDKYEIEGDYVIAYKSCRNGGYSTYNFQHKYEVGKEYTAHCDCNVDDENSFGLSVGTKEYAFSYCKEKLLKVKIHIDDVGVIVRDGNHIRCSKLYVMEEV